MRYSLIGQAFSSGALDVDFGIAVAAVVKAARRRGISCAFDARGPEIKAWSESYFAGHDIPAATLPEDTAEIVVRWWPTGMHPDKTAFTVDIAFDPSEGSADADRVFALYTGGGAPIPDNVFINEAYGVLPEEIKRVQRVIVPNRAVVFMGLDVQDRQAGIIAELLVNPTPFASAIGITIPGGREAAGATVFSTTPWDVMRDADVAVTAVGFPHMMAAKLGITQVVMAGSVQEDARMLQVVATGERFFDYHGLLSASTDFQVAQFAKSLKNDLVQKDLRRELMLRFVPNGATLLATWVGESVGGNTFRNPFPSMGGADIGSAVKIPRRGRHRGRVLGR